MPRQDRGFKSTDRSYQHIITANKLFWPRLLLRHITLHPKRPGDLDLSTLKVVSESRVTWATSVPILVFLGLCVLDLGPMYATDRRQTHLTYSLNQQIFSVLIFN